jgi:hypothetical protein
MIVLLAHLQSWSAALTDSAVGWYDCLCVTVDCTLELTCTIWDPLAP